MDLGAKRPPKCRLAPPWNIVVQESGSELRVLFKFWSQNLWTLSANYFSFWETSVPHTVGYTPKWNFLVPPLQTRAATDSQLKCNQLTTVKITQLESNQRLQTTAKAETILLPKFDLTNNLQHSFCSFTFSHLVFVLHVTQGQWSTSCIAFPNVQNDEAGSQTSLVLPIPLLIGLLPHRPVQNKHSTSGIKIRSVVMHANWMFYIQ